MAGIHVAAHERLQNDVSAKLCETHVFDGFFAFRSTDDNNSRRFLVAVTKYFEEELFRKLQGWGHTGAQGRLWWPATYERMRSHPVTSDVTFSQFASRSTKSGNLRIRDVFAKMLMQIRGVTEEICAAIVETYPVPGALFSALAVCDTHAERIDLLSHISINFDPATSAQADGSVRGDESASESEFGASLSQSQESMGIDSQSRIRARAAVSRQRRKAGRRTVPKAVSGLIATLFSPS